MIAPDQQLILLVLISYMLYELAKLLVIENKAQDHSFVNINRRELITISFANNLRNLCEVLRNLRRTLFND
jgi:hypothetical protein